MNEPGARHAFRVQVRPVRGIGEYRACEQLQRCAWSFTGDLDVVPATQLIAAQRAGGLVLGAFLPGGRLCGFSYGFVGREPDGALLHYSHMTAVDPSLQGCGVGASLKWQQRRQVLESGIDRIVWTFDPLESVNAHFNFTKLGAVARTYRRDLYGQTSSELHRGTATDRLEAEWWLLSPRVQARATGQEPAVVDRLRNDPGAFPSVLMARDRPDGLLEPVPVPLRGKPRSMVCELPTDIQALKRADPELAVQWRIETRAVLEPLLRDGYHVRECVRAAGTPSRSRCLLRRGGIELDD